MTLPWIDESIVPVEMLPRVEMEPAIALSAAATVFHLPGKHDQASHGRGGAQGVKVNKVASAFHENWRKTRRQEDGSFEPRVKKTTDKKWIAAHGTDQVDIANTSYDDLPSDWQAENKAAASVVVKIVDRHNGHVDLTDDKVRRDVGSEIHNEWLSRNTWAKGGDLDVPFEDLPLDEQAKDLDQITVAERVLSDGVTAAGEVHVFHLPGQHDQSTHGRGGSGNSAELAAASRLNDGKKLDTNDPTNAKIVGGIGKWTQGSNELGQIKYEMNQAARDPDLDTEGATLMRTVAGAPANAPELYRGMEGVNPRDIPAEGHVIKLGPTSFTRSKGMRDEFAQPTAISSFGHNTSVKITLKKNSRSLQIDQHARPVMQREKEHISMGTFRVTKSSSREVDVKAKNGQKGKVTLFELEMEQVPDTMEATVNSRETVVLPPGW